MSSDDYAGGILTIDLDAVAHNYRALAARAPGATAAAVVKADAYGLGLAPVAGALAGAGCATFFVANIDEGIALRTIAADGGFDAEIFVLSGATTAGSINACARQRLIPVLQTPDQIAAWRAHAAATGPATVALEFDTGMSRLGLTPREAESLAADPALLTGLEPRLLVSHLACADEPDHPLNAEQLTRFEAIRAAFPGVASSFANSAGILLGPPYHCDMVRPGAALYGVAAGPGIESLVRPVVALSGRILRVRDVDSDSAVGYGATARVGHGKRLATVAVGYADGYLRALSNRSCGFVGETRVPLVGRVSMDLTVFDVTGAPPGLSCEGQMIELIGPHHSVDEMAAEAGTIGYEILTSLGGRFRRHYLGKAHP